jgi:hypothetical protein
MLKVRAFIDFLVERFGGAPWELTALKARRSYRLTAK